MKIRINVLIFFYFTTVGTLMPFIPLLFHHRGLSASQIGFLMALGPLVSLLVQSPWGVLSDRLQTVKKIIMLQMVATLLLSLLLFNIESFYRLIPVVFVFFAFFLPTFPLLDCLILSRIKETGESFGSYRLWGSLGFATAALSVGALLTVIGIERVGYIYQALLVFSILLAIPVADAQPAGKSFNTQGLRELFGNKQIISVLILMALINAANRANDTFMGIHIENLGGSAATVGWAWTVAPLSEVPVFALFGFLLMRLREEALLALGAVFYALRWLLFALATVPEHIVIIQLLHGLSFGLIYMAGVSYINKVVTPGLRASGQGMLATFFSGLAGITGSLLGGFIMDLYGPVFLYGGSSLLALLAAGLLIMLVKRKANKD